MDRYVINGVIPPDEYAVNVNNSVYTNVVAMMSLRFATYARFLYNCQILTFKRTLLNLPPPPPLWSDIIRKMRLPIDTSNSIYLEYDGYNGELIKQADVVLLGFPLMFPMVHF